MAATALQTAQQRLPRERIVAAAVACFARSGFHGASMQEICAEAGMSPGALYRYFPSKTSIILAICEAEREKHTHFFEGMAQARDPVETLAGIGIDTLDAYLAGPSAAINAETIAEAIRNPDIRATYRRNLDDAKSVVADALARGQTTGTVDPSLDPKSAATLLLALGDGLAAHQALDPALASRTLRTTMETLVRRFLRPAALLLALAIPPAQAADPPTVTSQAVTPQAVTTVAASFGPIAERVGLTGTLVPREEILVSPQIGDLAIIEILVEEGDRVQAGQILARLARDQLDASRAQNAAAIARADAAIAQSRAGVIEANANKTQADLALARTRSLAANGNAPRETLEQRQAASETAAARVDAAQSTLRAAAADLALAQAQKRELDVRIEHTDIRAPVAGLVSRRTARLGAMVQSAGEPLFRLIGNGTVELEADVPETQLARLRPGQPAEIETASGHRTGHVRLVSPEVSRTTRLGRVRVEIEGQGPLVIGSFARADIQTARRDGVLVPLSAILFQSGGAPNGAIVQVVHDGTIETRPVTVGLRDAGQAEIAAGLQKGEQVVAISGTFIRDGDRVTAIPRSGT